MQMGWWMVVQQRIRKALKSKEGFTLLEMMLVMLVFVTCLAIVSVPLAKRSMEAEEARFIQQVERELYHAQSYAIAHNVNVTVRMFKEGEQAYDVRAMSKPAVLLSSGAIPASFKQPYTGLKHITYLKNGMIQEFGVMHLMQEKQTYSFVFQIGGGRFYVAKQ